MDGTLAAIFLIASLGDMTLNDCPTGCLAGADARARVSFQIADVEFDTASISKEIYIGYDFGSSYGPFQPTIGASVTDQGDAWVGIGAKFVVSDLFGTGLFAETSLMPGLHFQGDGPDLGGNLHFRSALGIGYEFDNGATLTASYDHRSNADTLPLNPGLETVSIRYAIPLN